MGGGDGGDGGVVRIRIVVVTVVFGSIWSHITLHNNHVTILGKINTAETQTNQTKTDKTIDCFNLLQVLLIA